MKIPIRGRSHRMHFFFIALCCFSIVFLHKHALNNHVLPLTLHLFQCLTLKLKTFLKASLHFFSFHFTVSRFKHENTSHVLTAPNNNDKKYKNIKKYSENYFLEHFFKLIILTLIGNQNPVGYKRLENLKWQMQCTLIKNNIYNLL